MAGQPGVAPPRRGRKRKEEELRNGKKNSTGHEDKRNRHRRLARKMAERREKRYRHRRFARKMAERREHSSVPEAGQQVSSVTPGREGRRQAPVLMRLCVLSNDCVSR